MTGVIWMVQVLVYPQFMHVGEAEFLLYHGEHMRLIGTVVGPLLLLELLAASGMLVKSWRSPDRWIHGISWVLVILLWGVTAFIQVPLHNDLAQNGFSQETVTSLVASNWVRTFLWSLRASLLVYILKIRN